MSTETTVHRFFRAVDTRDWETVAHLLGDEVATDYTSLFGGEPETLPRGELVDRWRGMLPGFDATQHFLGPLVAGEDGRVEANVRGYHHLARRTWMVAGWYTLTLSEDATRITGIVLDTTYDEGGRDLVEAAQRRAAAR